MNDSVKKILQAIVTTIVIVFILAGIAKCVSDQAKESANFREHTYQNY